MAAGDSTTQRGTMPYVAILFRANVGIIISSLDMPDVANDTIIHCFPNALNLDFNSDIAQLRLRNLNARHPAFQPIVDRRVALGENHLKDPIHFASLDLLQDVAQEI